MGRSDVSWRTSVRRTACYDAFARYSSNASTGMWTMPSTTTERILRSRTSTRRSRVEIPRRGRPRAPPEASVPPPACRSPLQAARPLPRGKSRSARPEAVHVRRFDSPPGSLVSRVTEPAVGMPFADGPSVVMGARVPEEVVQGHLERYGRSQRPPPTSRRAPVTYEARSEQSHATASAISVGRPARPIGMVSLRRSMRSGCPPVA